MNDKEISIETLTERRDELRADLRAAQQAEVAADQKQREAQIRNDPGKDEAIREWRDAKAVVESIQGAIEDLEELLPELHEATTTTAARRRGVGVLRAIGSLRNEYEQDLQRVKDAAAALAEVVERLNGRHGVLRDRFTEILVLAERFGTEVPEDMRMPVAPAKDAGVAAALKKAAGVELADPYALPPRLAGAPFRSGFRTLTVRRALARVQGTPTADLLDQAGAGILADEEAWEARRRREHDESRDRGDAARKAEAEAYDEWVREALADGPVPVADLEREAAEDGMRWRWDRNHPHASISEAAQRMGVFAVVPEKGEGALHWTLRRADGYVIPPDAVRSMQQAAAMR